MLFVVAVIMAIHALGGLEYHPSQGELDYLSARAMSLFVIIGAVCAVAGLALLVTGVRKHRAQRPTHVAMLIGGMMLTAFGLVLAGFAIAYQRAAPLDLNAAEPTP